MMRSSFGKLLVLLLLTSALFFPSIGNSEKLDIEQARTFILETLKNYCSDSYFMIQEYLNTAASADEYFNEEQYDIMQYVKGYDKQDLLTSINTIVQENCHTYSSLMAELTTARYDFSKYSYYYIGENQAIKVEHTPIYLTKELNQTFPEEYKTAHYESAIYPSNPLRGCQRYGIYGLLDELNAYYHGSRAMYKLLEIYKTEFAEHPEQWLEYLENLTATFYAYHEMNFYILHYLDHAQKRHPVMYEGIISNTDFRKAYQAIDDKFVALEKEFAMRKESLFKSLRKNRIKIKEDDTTFSIKRKSSKNFKMDIDKIKQAIQNEKYQRIEVVLASR